MGFIKKAMGADIVLSEFKMAQSQLGANCHLGKHNITNPSFRQLNSIYAHYFHKLHKL